MADIVVSNPVLTVKRIYEQFSKHSRYQKRATDQTTNHGVGSSKLNVRQSRVERTERYFLKPVRDLCRKKKSAAAIKRSAKTAVRFTVMERP